MMARITANARPLGVVVGLLVLWNAVYLLVPASLAPVAAVFTAPMVLFVPGLLAIVALGARQLSAVTAIFAVGFSVVLVTLIGLMANFLPRLFGVDRPLDGPAVYVLFNLAFLELALLAALFYEPLREAPAPAPAPVPEPVMAGPFPRPAGSAGTERRSGPAAGADLPPGLAAASAVGPLTFPLTFTGAGPGAVTRGPERAEPQPQPEPAGRRPRRGVEARPSARNRIDTALCAAATVLPLLAVLGAVSLNNEGPNTLAVRALLGSALLVPVTFALRRRIRTSTMLWVVVSITAVLLLGTSLRGWYVSGQDAQHELQVFNLALTRGSWDVTAYRDPYNACMSITLFPVALSKLLRLDGAWVFKLFTQLVFLVVPVAVFTVVRQFAGRGSAFIGALLFVGLPTLTLDVPFITRQEIAFVFVALAVAAMFTRSDEWLDQARYVVFLAMALGVILSHYSTAYLFVTALVLTSVGGRLYAAAGRRRPALVANQPEQQIPVWVTGIVMAAAYVWLGLVTGAGGALVETLGKSLGSVTQVLTNPSVVLRTLGSPNGGDAGQVLSGYVKGTAADPGVDAASIVRGLHIVSSSAPPTALTTIVRDITGVDLAGLCSTLYYGVATKLYLLLVMVGLVLMFRRKIRARLGGMPALYPVWCVSVGTVLTLQLLFPALAGDYGVSRSFMQAFIVLCVPMVVGLSVVARARTRLRDGLLITAATAMFALYSGLVPYLTGGLHYQLSLANAGQYYGTVYPRTTDLAAFSWVQDHLPPGSKVNVADNAAVYGYHPLFSYDATSPGIMPFQVAKGDYAVLAHAQVVDNIVYSFNQLIGLRFGPSSYSNSDLLYSSSDVQLFRK